MKLLNVVLLLSLALGVGCGDTSDSTTAEEVQAENPDPAHNSQNSLDWMGVYRGVLPCADCEGIRTRIAISTDGTFTKSIHYLGKEDRPRYSNGKFSWNDAGSVITLADVDGSKRAYAVGENQIIHLDNDGNRITGDLERMYVLAKNPTDRQLENKRWILDEMDGKKVESPGGDRQNYIRLNNQLGRISGLAICNQFTGIYDLEPQNRISFATNMGVTLMACERLDEQEAFMDALAASNSYTVTDTVLTFSNESDSATPLLRFVAD